MTLTVRVITAEQHLEYIASRPSVSFLQTPAWGSVKSGWHSESLGWFAGEQLVGAGLVLYRSVPRLPQRSLAYLPEGPDLDWTGQVYPEHDLKDWMEPLLQHLKQRGSFTIKMGPPIVLRRWSAQTLKAAIATGQATRLRDITPDWQDQHAIDITQRLRNARWQQEDSDEAGFGDYQPRYVFQLPLQGKTEEDLLRGFNQLWRRNIKKAAKAGVTVEQGTIDDLPAFHEVYVETAERDQFTPQAVVVLPGNDEGDERRGPRPDAAVPRQAPRSPAGLHHAGHRRIACLVLLRSLQQRGSGGAPIQRHPMADDPRFAA